MIYNKPVAVVRNKFKGFLGNLPTRKLFGVLLGGLLKKPFFIVLTITVPHTIEMNLNGLLGREHKGYVQSPRIPLTRLCARYWLKLVGHGETSYQIKRIASPSVEVGLLRRWAYGGGYSPLGVLLSKTK
jgi:hypothetical protein